MYDTAALSVAFVVGLLWLLGIVVEKYNLAERVDDWMFPSLSAVGSFVWFCWDTYSQW